MDNKSHKHKTSNYDHRLRSDRRDKFPNGYLEDWDINSKSHKSTPKSSSQKPVPKSSSKNIGFSPVSIILSTQSNLILNNENNYNISFSTGILEGSGISINTDGNEISFSEQGSYRFEICGEGAPFTDVDVSLIFFSDLFSSDVKPFSEISVPKDDGKLQLRGLATILPIQPGQKIYPRLQSFPDESIVLLSNTRLIIHRVA